MKKKIIIYGEKKKQSTMFVVILLVSIFVVVKIFHSCPTLSDLHTEMSLSLVSANWIVALGCESVNAMVEACQFYTNNLFIIKECFANV